MKTELKNELITEGSGIIFDFIGEHPIKTGAKFTLEEYVSGGLYHKSWDWLMPVIKKISDELSYDWYMDNIVNHLLNNNIQGAFELCIDAIKIFNERDGGN